MRWGWYYALVSGVSNWVMCVAFGVNRRVEGEGGVVIRPSK